MSEATGPAVGLGSRGTYAHALHPAQPGTLCRPQSTNLTESKATRINCSRCLKLLGINHQEKTGEMAIVERHFDPTAQYPEEGALYDEASGKPYRRLHRMLIGGREGPRGRRLRDRDQQAGPASGRWTAELEAENTYPEARTQPRTTVEEGGDERRATTQEMREARYDAWLRGGRVGKPPRLDPWPEAKLDRSALRPDDPRRYRGGMVTRNPIHYVSQKEASMLARLDGISVDELLSERGPYRGRLRLRGGNAAKNPSSKPWPSKAGSLTRMGPPRADNQTYTGPGGWTVLFVPEGDGTWSQRYYLRGEVYGGDETPRTMRKALYNAGQEYRFEQVQAMTGRSAVSRNTHLSKGAVVRHAGRGMKVVRVHSTGYILQPTSGDRRFVSVSYPDAAALSAVANPSKSKTMRSTRNNSRARDARGRFKSKPSTSKARPSRARSAKGYTVKQLKGSVQVGPGKYAKNPWVVHYDGLPIERASGMAYGLTKAKAQQIASKLRGRGAGEAEYKRMHDWLGAHHNPRKRDRKGRFTKTAKRGSSKSKGRRSPSKSNRRRDSLGRFV